MLCVPGSIALLERHARTLAGGAGVHLQLTEGKPCLPAHSVPSLVASDGNFARSRSELGPLEPDDIRREWQAQIEIFMEVGLAPTHVDTHQHVHKEPAIFEVFLAIAQRYRIAARVMNPAQATSLRSAGVPCVDYCQTNWYGNITAESLIACLSEAWRRVGSTGTVELMCHPGQIDADLSLRSRYVGQRQLELDILCSTDLTGNGVRLIGMPELKPSIEAL
jgi:predicted glycoside hydrolase/deacetylase ChbG (UPF0249 family)